MGKVFGILLMVIAIWAALEYYTGSADSTLSGSLRSISDEAVLPQSGGEFVTVPKKAGRAVQRAIDAGAERYEGLLED